MLQDLEKDLSSELSGNFEEVVLALFMTPSEYDAHELKCSMEVGSYCCLVVTITVIIMD